jgi:hypothetical protein
MLQSIKRQLRDTAVGSAVRSARRSHRQRPAAQQRAIEELRRTWEADGCPVPAPNALKIDEVASYARRFGPRVFVETGTYRGDTLEVMKRHVAQAFSIELAPELASLARVRFAADAHVEILEGDSATLLPGILEKLYEPALFWLDGHWSMGETAKAADFETPIRAELDAVLRHRVSDHVVLIDDARLFGTGDYPTIDEIEAMVRDHRPDWKFSVVADIIRAHP